MLPNKVSNAEVHYALVPYLMVVHDFRQDVAQQAANEVYKWLSTTQLFPTLPSPEVLEEWLKKKGYIKAACDVDYGT